MNKNILNILILITGVLFIGAAISPVDAAGVSYPVAELGNCADQTSCKAYCDKPVNIDACLSFAEKNNLMSKEEIKVAKNFKNTNMTGPGGCKGKDECKSYCNGPDHMDECIAFAEKNGMMSGKKLEEAKKVKGAITKGIKPPACGGKEACDVYCSSSEHVEECVNFGEAAGIISKEDAKKIRKGPDGKKGQGQGKQGPDGQQGGDKGKGQGQGQGQGKSNGGGQGQGGDKQRSGERPGGQDQGQGQQGPRGQDDQGPGLN